MHRFEFVGMQRTRLFHLKLTFIFFIYMMRMTQLNQEKNPRHLRHPRLKNENKGRDCLR